MKFLDRLILLAKADAHGVLEQLEERGLLAKQLLREAELELDRKRARMEALAEEARRLTTEAERLEAEAAALDEDVQLALAGDKEELARFSVRRLLPVRRGAESARARTAELAVERERLAATLADQESQLEGMRERVAGLLSARHSDGPDPLARPAAVPDEEVELELLRRRAAGEAGR